MNHADDHRAERKAPAVAMLMPARVVDRLAGMRVGMKVGGAIGVAVHVEVQAIPDDPSDHVEAEEDEDRRDRELEVAREVPG